MGPMPNHTSNAAGITTISALGPPYSEAIPNRISSNVELIGFFEFALMWRGQVSGFRVEVSPSFAYTVEF